MVDKRLFCLLLCSVTLSITAQTSLDDLDRKNWADAVSPLQTIPLPLPVRDRLQVDEQSPGMGRGVSLSGTWTLYGHDEAGHEVQVNAKVPGSIHQALMDANVIPDPRLGKNALIAERCSYRPWTLERTFNYDGSMTDPLLTFTGVANKCRIWLNGKMIGEHEGMFGGPDIAIAPYLKTGENHIKVELEAIPETYNGGWPATANEAWKHTVVANCVYGWHYTKIPSMGIWNDVLICDRPQLRIEHPFIITRTTDGDMRLCLDFPQLTNAEVRLQVKPANFKGIEQTYKADVKEAIGLTAFDFHIDDPQLWWPNDKGNQPLYMAEILLVSQGQVVYTCSKRFGIRTIQMKPFPEGAKDSLYNWTFCLNGQEMFVKGTGWCTMDALLDFSYDRYKRFLTVAQQQHVQLIRAWGGGLPETDTFYDLCDELGIMVIQEWPTAWNSHETQPYDMLRETVERNTLRLRNHPSLVMWGGGNESEKPYGKAIDMMGRLSVELDGTRPFHRAEAWGGSRHDYNCWWEDKHLDHNLTMTARFWGEFGIPSLPHPESVRRYLDGEPYQWPPKAESTFTHHTPIFGINGEIRRLEQYAGYFMPTASLKDIITGSQLAQVVGVRHTLERARCMWPQTAGALYYKLNDNYPGLSWSSVDYYGAIKPIHYFARRAFEPIQTVLLFEHTDLTAQEVSLPYYLLDDNMALKGQTAKARVSIWNHQMTCVLDTTFTLKPASTVERIGEIRLLPSQTTSEMLYFKTDLMTADGQRIARNWYFTNYETQQGIIMKSAPAEVTMTQTGDKITITNRSDRPAIGVTVSTPGHAEVFMPSDNYLWIDPHETVVISTNDYAQAALDWWNKSEPFGVNIACGDFGSRFPGEYNKDYTYPTDDDLVFWQQKGLMLVRMPFRWERLQHTPGGPLCQEDLQHVKAFIGAAEKRGMKVLLDMHNYCRRLDGGQETIIGTDALSYESYGQFWRMLADELKGFSNLYGYGLMNEPHDLPKNVSWAKMAQTAIDSIRSTDMRTAIMVGGYHWSSARRWVHMSDHLRHLKDPADNLVFEAHCYFDFDGSGTYKFSYEQEEGTPDRGVELVRPFVEWLNRYHLRGIIGEYGIPEGDERWEETLDHFLAYLSKNGVPALYWASGPWWTDAVMTIPSYHGGPEGLRVGDGTSGIKPQVKIMEKYKVTGEHTPFSHGALRVDGSGRYLQHTDGTPFLYLGDTAWEMLTRLNYEETCRYLDDRASKGFSVIQTVVIPELESVGELSASGAPIFSEEEPSIPHAQYLNHIDSVLTYAEERGLYVALLPTWGDKVDKQWGKGPVLFDAEKARVYGTFLGKRWAARKNIIWIIGGDRSGDNSNMPIWKALAQSIKSTDHNHLMTYHPHGEHSSSMWFHHEDWLDFNMIQTGHCQQTYNIYKKLMWPDMMLMPAKPVMDGEPRYEDICRNFKPSDGRFAAIDVRHTLYQSMLSGACGYTYGNNNIWQMYAPGRKPECDARTYWYDALNMDGACQLKHFISLWKDYPFTKGTPLRNSTKALDDYDNDKAVALYTNDWLIVYFPGGSQWQITLPSEWKKGACKLTWMDPQTGIRRGDEVQGTKFEVRRNMKLTLPSDDGNNDHDWIAIIKRASP